MKRSTVLALSLSLLFSVSPLAPRTFAAELPTDSQIVVNHAGAQASYTGPAQYFTGHVQVSPFFSATKEASYSGAYVTFEAGARTAWHTHPIGQRLIITAGSGFVQEWGKPIIEVKAGDTVWFPPGVKHWHGASPTSSMTHLALTGIENKQSATWLEKVSDEEYAQPQGGNVR